MKTGGKANTKVSGNVERELMLIDGEWTTSEGGGFIPSKTRQREELSLRKCPRAMEADVDHAVSCRQGL